jgi:dolichol-phosphate mannosyltransferase
MTHLSHSRLALSVVAPCYNEEQVVRELHRRLSAVCQGLCGEDYELILVNDGSRDATWTILQTLAHSDARVVAADLSRNHGHQLALSAGLSLVRGERILVIDADLQDPPELLPEMMRLMDDGADVVYGQRTEREDETWFKKASAAIFYRLLLRISDVKIPADTGDFRLMKRQVVDTLIDMPEYQRFIRGMIAWIGFRQVPLRYRRDKRFAGETKYPLKKMLNFATDAITGFSVVPLRISLYVACFFVGLAGSLVIYVLYAWLFMSGVVPGWTSILLGMLVFSAVQLLSLAVIGEYLGRTYLQTKHRPLFIIREIASRSSPVENSLARMGTSASDASHENT